MQNSDHTARAGFSDHCPRILLGITRVNDHRFALLARQGKLFGECAPLLETRRVVVVIVEPALPYCYSSFVNQRAKLVDITRCIKTDCVVRVNSSRVKDESEVTGGDGCGCASGAEDIPGAAARADADYCLGSIVTCSCDYRAAVAVERRVGEVRVAVDVPREIPIFLGHCLSIQRSVGPAM